MYVFHILPILFQEFLTIKEWKAFLHSSSEFTELKYKTMYIVLSHYYSHEFYIDEKFRLKVLSSIANPAKQLSVNISCMKDIVDFSIFQQVHTLIAAGCSTLTNQDIQLFSHSTIVNLSYNQTISDISPLQHVKKLDLSHCLHINNFISLSKQLKYLNLSNCQQITNEHLSDFQDLIYLNVACCTKITNISYCHKIPILNLYYCYNLLNLNGLGEAQREVNLAYCSKVSDVSMLTKVKKLDISGVRLIVDLSKLKELEDLTVTSSQTIKDLSPLISLKVLRFNHLTVHFPLPWATAPVANNATTATTPEAENPENDAEAEENDEDEDEEDIPNPPELVASSYTFQTYFLVSPLALTALPLQVNAPTSPNVESSTVPESVSQGNEEEIVSPTL